MVIELLKMFVSILASGSLGRISKPPPASATVMKDANATLATRDALLAQAPNTTWIVDIGPLANAGLLFATFPELVEHVAGLSIMGGAVGAGLTEAKNGKTAGSLRKMPTRGLGTKQVGAS